MAIPITKVTQSMKEALDRYQFGFTDLSKMYGSNEFWEDHGTQYKYMSQAEREATFTPDQISALDRMLAKYEQEEKVRRDQEEVNRKHAFQAKRIQEAAAYPDEEAANAAYDCTLEQCENLFRTVFGGKWFDPGDLIVQTAHWYMFRRLLKNDRFEERQIADTDLMIITIRYRLKGT